jgi:hypothetical protein
MRNAWDGRPVASLPGGGRLAAPRAVGGKPIANGTLVAGVRAQPAFAAASTSGAPYRFKGGAPGAKGSSVGASPATGGGGGGGKGGGKG